MDNFDIVANQYFTAFFTTFGIIILCVCFVFYIFRAIGLYTIAKRRGLSAPYTAWIPVASSFLFGKIAEQYESAERSKSKPYRKILLGLDIPKTIIYMVSIVFFIFAFYHFFANAPVYMDGGNYLESYNFYYDLFNIPFNILCIVYLVFYYIALYKVYQSLSPSSSTLYLVLSIIFGIDPFVLFALRKKDEGFIILNDQYRAEIEAFEQARYQQQYGQQQQSYSSYQGAPYFNTNQPQQSYTAQYQQPQPPYSGQYQQPQQQYNAPYPQQFGQQQQNDSSYQGAPYFNTNQPQQSYTAQYQQPQPPYSGQYQQPQQPYNAPYQQPGGASIREYNEQQYRNRQNFSSSQSNIIKPQDDPKKHGQYGAQAYQPQQQYSERKPERTPYSENAQHTPADKLNGTSSNEPSGNL